MKHSGIRIAVMMAILASPIGVRADDASLSASDQSGSFHPPVRLKAGDDFVSVESPGYACPTVADVDGDGIEDLVVGQFRNGQMQFFKNIASVGQEPQFAKSQWLMTGEERATVPGVW